MSDITAFFARHSDVESSHLATARALATSGATSQASAGAVSCSDLARTFAARARHLATLSTEHARRLRQQTFALLAALERASDASVRCFSIASPDGATFSFFERVDTFELLGAIHSRDARKLSGSDWQEIWGTAPPPRPR